MTIIAPSLLAADTFKLEQQINEVESAGISRLHLDIMDGHYVPNINFGDKFVKEVRAHTKAELDIHLLTETPEKYVDQMIDAGGDIINFHPETTRQPVALINHIHARGKKVGIALDPGLSYRTYLPLLDFVDQVLVMTVSPGFGGQKFIPEMLHKIHDINTMKNTNMSGFDIEVDGGIDDLTGAQCTEVGATALVSGSFIFKDDIKKAINSLK